MPSRPHLPRTIETEILIRSRRRCCVCYGLKRDLAEKRGQIAHLDRHRENNRPDNLAYFCLDHHDQYDSRTSQSKGLTEGEAKHYRQELYAALENGMSAPQFWLREPGSAPEKRPIRWTQEHEEALKFFTGTQRSQAVVLALRNSSASIKEITGTIPPHDVNWMELIVKDLIAHGWVKQVAGDQNVFTLTENARRMLDALEEIPQPIKDEAWNQTWRYTPENERTFKIDRSLVETLNRLGSPDPIDTPMLDYVKSLPSRRRAVYARARPEWDSGVTARMVNATYTINNSFVEILVALSSCYPRDSFGDLAAKGFWKEFVRSRYSIQRETLDKQGEAGSIANVLATGRVMDDLEQMIAGIVNSITNRNNTFDYDSWYNDWSTDE